MTGTGLLRGPGVLFVEDFDEVARIEDEPPEIIAPHYSAEDLEAAREEGRAAGAEEARSDCEVIQSALCAAALAAIGDGLASARDQVKRVAESRAEEIAAAILALLGAALPAAASRLAPQEITALLDMLLPPLCQMPEVRVRVHPDLLERISAHVAIYDGVTAIADAALAPPDVAVTWQDGHARRDWAELWAQLTTALAPFELAAGLAQHAGG
jgi:flagellar assembly protein FliH